MDEERTTAVVQRYLDELAGDTPAEQAVRALLDRAVSRLHQLCAALLYRSYPRLTRPPLNLQADELLGAVVERLLKALRATRPVTVRQFFALANQHLRWELNEMARRLDEQRASHSRRKPPRLLRAPGRARRRKPHRQRRRGRPPHRVVWPAVPGACGQARGKNKQSSAYASPWSENERRRTRRPRGASASRSPARVSSRSSSPVASAAPTRNAGTPSWPSQPQFQL